MAELDDSICQVCHNLFGGRAEHSSGDYNRVDIKCGMCGRFSVGAAVVTKMENRDVTTRNRSHLSYVLRRRFFAPQNEKGIIELTKETVEDVLDGTLRPPNHLIQAQNLIRFIGRCETAAGEPVWYLPLALYAYVGCHSPDAVTNLAHDLRSEGLVAFTERPSDVNGYAVADLRLTMEGWRRWEELENGASVSRDGFIAMQFGDERLDRLVEEVIRPALREHLNVEVRRLDSRDVVKAGVIDNIMRDAIRDAAFVLADLSHGNRGAYWEAGFAEGLGKPVIYLCERPVWEGPNKPHFDVNHCLTVMWTEGEKEQFIQNLVASIKNSLAS